MNVSQETMLVNANELAKILSVCLTSTIISFQRQLFLPFHSDSYSLD